MATAMKTVQKTMFKPSTTKRTPETVRFTAKEREFVYGVAMKYMKDEERASDVAQDAMMLAYRHRDSFRGGPS